MEYDVMIARSVTHAQRMERAMGRYGIRAQIFRAPRELTDLGCAYAVQVDPRDLRAALTIIRGEQLHPVKIFFYRNGIYQEVAL